MILRLATPRDSAAMSALIASAIRDFVLPDCTAEGAAELLTTVSPEALDALLDDENYRYHVAVLDGVIVGVAGVRHHRHLLHLFVASAHHRRGIATALWDHVRAECEAAGNSGHFTVNASSYARPFYRSLGFEVAAPPVTKNGITSTPMVWTRR